MLSGQFQFQRLPKFQLTCIRTAWFKSSSVTTELLLSSRCFNLQRKLTTGRDGGNLQQGLLLPAISSTGAPSEPHPWVSRGDASNVYPTSVNLSSWLAYGSYNTVTFRNDTHLRSRHPRTGYGVNSHSPGVCTNMEWLSHMLTGCFPNDLRLHTPLGSVKVPISHTAADTVKSFPCWAP